MKPVEQYNKIDFKIEFAHKAKLIFIGICLTFITNIPSSYMHTGVNTAVNEFNEYLNQSYVERDDPLQEHEFAIMRSIYNICWYAFTFIHYI